MSNQQTGTAMEGMLKVKGSDAALRDEHITEFDEWRIVGVLCRQPSRDVVEPRPQMQLRRVP
eukprot:1400984-Pleurochrysis_carterae.AAC.1